MDKVPTEKTAALERFDQRVLKTGPVVSEGRLPLCNIGFGADEEAPVVSVG
jgi:hypothetical protein